MKYLFLWLVPALAECLVVCIIFATYFQYAPLAGEFESPLYRNFFGAGLTHTHLNSFCVLLCLGLHRVDDFSDSLAKEIPQSCCQK